MTLGNGEEPGRARSHWMAASGDPYARHLGSPWDAEEGAWAWGGIGPETRTPRVSSTAASAASPFRPQRETRRTRSPRKMTARNRGRLPGDQRPARDRDGAPSFGLPNVRGPPTNLPPSRGTGSLFS